MNHESEKMDHGSGEGESESGDSGAKPEDTLAPSRPPNKFNFSRIPPDPAEIDEYARLHSIPHNVAAKFYAHYYGNGWTVNGAPMANWGAKLSEWAMGGIK